MADRMDTRSNVALNTTFIVTVDIIFVSAVLSLMRGTRIEPMPGTLPHWQLSETRRCRGPPLFPEGEQADSDKEQAGN
ncbi:MAG: hypothetical protein O7C72_03145 [Deltaproteobacteria bacterium]|nr:hypothetical protein [Deltaproteobacteria bacterium]